MDYVGLLNMGLNWKVIYDIYPPNVGLYLKIKENKTHCNSRKLLPSPQRGALGLYQDLKTGRRDKRPLTQRNGYIYTHRLLAKDD